MKRILITGASSGIGAEVAKLLAERGETLSLAGRSRGKLEALGVSGTLLPGDLTQPGVAVETVSQAASAMGGLDVVVHCAGIGLIQPAAKTSDGDFTRVMNTNARGTFLVAQAACEEMAKARQGLFVTLPGILGKAPMRNASAYCASKYAVTGLLKCMAQEYARSGIRISLLFLGGVDTPFWDNLGTSFQKDKMIPCATAADLVLHAIDSPSHLVLSELVMQPDSHQLV